MSLPNEGFSVLGEDELALWIRRFGRMHENPVNSRRNSRTCFRCGKLGHFIANCPEEMEAMDNYKQWPMAENKHRARREHKHNNKDKWRSKRKDGHDKMVLAMVGASDADSSSAYSTSSSIVVK
jgi:hypothetical protein